MPIDRSDAEQIATFVLRAGTLCNDAVLRVKQNDSLGQVQVFGRLAGEWMGQSYTNILMPIWRKFPDLEPPEVKQGYVEHEPALSSESQESIRAFIAEARAAVNLANDVPQDGRASFDFGGISEVEGALAAIEAFLASPRHQESRESNPI
jgi:hypothetical protein